jgi:hypothetical protein
MASLPSASSVSSTNDQAVALAEELLALVPGDADRRVWFGHCDRQKVAGEQGREHRRIQPDGVAGERERRCHSECACCAQHADEVALSQRDQEHDETAHAHQGTETESCSEDAGDRRRVQRVRA